jgi:hypothetical protein
VPMNVQPPPEPALLVMSAIVAEATLFDELAHRFPEAMGRVVPVGEETSFDWTDYYAKEMGTGLRRRFFAGERLVPRELLADLKRLTNQLEQSFAREDRTRKVNLDPGLLTLGNFVLASTKNNAHRIYLRDGIFAEVTLRFVRGAFVPMEWTYPDYASDRIRDLLCGLRTGYQNQLRNQPEVLQEEKFYKEVAL